MAESGVIIASYGWSRTPPDYGVLHIAFHVWASGTCQHATPTSVLRSSFYPISQSPTLKHWSISKNQGEIVALLLALYSWGKGSRQSIEKMAGRPPERAVEVALARLLDECL